MTRKGRKVVDTEYRCGCTTGLLMPSGAAFADRCTKHSKKVETILAGRIANAIHAAYGRSNETTATLAAVDVMAILASTQ